MAKGELNWDDLRYFLSAGRTKALARTAREMGVEHTTIGRRLSALEEALGAPLVMRGPEGLSLTLLGERVFRLAEKVEHAALAIRDLVAQERSHVRLAVPSGFPQLFTSALGTLRAAHPEIALEIVSGARPVDLKKGEADIAIRTGSTDPELVARKLCVSGFSLYASQSYLGRRGAPTSANDLHGHDVVGFDARLAATPPAKWIEARVPQESIVFRSREMTDVVTAVLSGVGLAVLPCMLGDAEPALTRLTPEVVASHAMSLVYRREARVSASVRAVIRFVVDVIKQNSDRISGRHPRS